MNYIEIYVEYIRCFVIAEYMERCLIMGETIAAIATGMGDSGIGIIRISGDTALQIVNQVFQPVNKKKTILKM